MGKIVSHSDQKQQVAELEVETSHSATIEARSGQLSQHIGEGGRRSMSPRPVWTTE